MKEIFIFLFTVVLLLGCGSQTPEVKSPERAETKSAAPTPSPAPLALVTTLPGKWGTVCKNRTQLIFDFETDKKLMITEFKYTNEECTIEQYKVNNAKPYSTNGTSLMIGNAGQRPVITEYAIANNVLSLTYLGNALRLNRLP